MTQSSQKLYKDDVHKLINILRRQQYVLNDNEHSRYVKYNQLKDVIQIRALDMQIDMEIVRLDVDSSSSGLILNNMQTPIYTHL